MKIKEFVMQDLEDYETKEDKINYLKDVLQHGCQSGMVSRLIYYHDTNKFYDDNEEEIEEILDEFKEMLGVKSRPEAIAQLNGSAEDITQEKNLLSWMAYEETARKVLTEDFGVDY